MGFLPGIMLAGSSAWRLRAGRGHAGAAQPGRDIDDRPAGQLDTVSKDVAREGADEQVQLCIGPVVESVK